MKTCKKCNIEKDLSCFHFRNDTLKYRGNCKECLSKSCKKMYEKNKENRRETAKRWKENNLEKLRKYQKEYHAKNKERRNLNESKRKQNNIYRLKKNIYGMVYKSIVRGGWKKQGKTAEILGCSFNELKTYLENQFQPWMNWENKGKYNGSFNYGWDIDHIIPLSTAKTQEEVVLLNHYTNLRPLCSKINRDIKKDKL